MMMMILLYGSSLCLKTVSSLLNLALKAMKLESPAPKQSLINLSQPQGVRASDQIPLFKFRKEIFWTPGQIEYPVGSHLCESNFGLKPKSRLRIHLYNDHQLENPWPLPLKGLGLEMIGRWSTMRTKIPEFGENGNVLRFLALNWIEESKIHLSDCFLICWEKFRTKPLHHHLDRSERLSRQFSIIEPCNYLGCNCPTWLFWAHFCLGKWAQKGGTGSRKEEKGGRWEAWGFTWRTPRLVTTWHATAPRVHRKLSEMFRKTGPKSKHDDPIIAHNSFMKESRDRKCELPHWFMLRRI